VDVVRRVLGFPASVNETSARLVAAGVLTQGVVFLAVRQWWVLVPLVYGFLARVLTGPKLSPLGQLVTRVVTPRLHIEHRTVAGPPKRFAQGVGLMFSGLALLAWILGVTVVSFVLIVGLVVAATLEAGFAVCLGCIAYHQLSRFGVVSADTCVECNDLSRRLSPANS
jgi:Domain of unknown function (DUF4395)